LEEKTYCFIFCRNWTLFLTFVPFRNNLELFLLKIISINQIHLIHFVWNQFKKGDLKNDNTMVEWIFTWLFFFSSCVFIWILYLPSLPVPHGANFRFVVLVLLLRKVQKSFKWFPSDPGPFYIYIYIFHCKIAFRDYEPLFFLGQRFWPYESP